MLKWTCNVEVVPKKKAWGSWILQTVYTRFLRCFHEKVTFIGAIIMDTSAENVVSTSNLSILPFSNVAAKKKKNWNITFQSISLWIKKLSGALYAFGFLNWFHDNSTITDSNLWTPPLHRKSLPLFLKQDVILENAKEKQWHIWTQNSTVRWQNIIKIAACEIQDYFLKANV